MLMNLSSHGSELTCSLAPNDHYPSSLQVPLDLAQAAGWLVVLVDGADWGRLAPGKDRSTAIKEWVERAK